MKCWDGYERVSGTKGSCRKRTIVTKKSNMKTRVSPKRRSKPKKVSPKRTKSRLVMPKRRSKPKKVSPKRTKSKRVSPKRTKSKRVSPKRTKSKRVSPKKKTSIRESLTYSTENDGVSMNNLPVTKDDGNSAAARRLEVLESLLSRDEKCSKYIKNPFLTLPYQEKVNMLAALFNKAFTGDINDEEEKNLEYLESAVNGDPVKVQEEKAYREKWVSKYMSPGKNLPSQAEFWYNTIIQYVPPPEIASYTTENKRVIKMFENMYRATNINNNFTSENAKKLAFDLYNYQKQSYDAMSKLAELKDELKEQQDQLKIVPVTKISDVNKIIDSKNALIDEQNAALSTLNSEIISIKKQIKELENFNNSAYWETPMSVLLTDDESTKTKLAEAQSTDPLILSDFVLPGISCPLNKVQTMNKNMLFDYESNSDCLLERDAYKLKIFASNISTKALLTFKSIASVTPDKPTDPGYRLQGGEFQGPKTYYTLAGFIVPKKLNISTKMPESGLAKCEMLAMYYFLDKVVQKPKDANIPSILEMIIKKVPITDDDIRDPQDSINEMLNSEDSIDSFFRTLYLTMTVPEYNTNTKNIQKALEISDEQFSQYLLSQKRESLVSKLIEITKQASEALEESKMLKQAGNVEEAIQKLSIKTPLFTAIDKAKKYTNGLEYNNAVEVVEKIKRAEKSYEIILANKPKKGVLKSPTKKSPAKPGIKGASSLLAGIQGGKKNLKSTGNNSLLAGIQGGKKNLKSTGNNPF
jgi:hypothetical protein